MNFWFWVYCIEALKSRPRSTRTNHYDANGNLTGYTEEGKPKEPEEEEWLRKHVRKYENTELSPREKRAIMFAWIALGIFIALQIWFFH
jgi:hypothetical protein